MKHFLGFIAKLTAFLIAAASLFVGISYFFKKKKLHLDELISKKSTKSEEDE